jgi:hypothetical protein
VGGIGHASSAQECSSASGVVSGALAQPAIPAERPARFCQTSGFAHLAPSRQHPAVAQAPEFIASELSGYLQSIPPPRVRGGTVSFLINIDLWGGGEPLNSTARPLFAPAE